MLLEYFIYTILNQTQVNLGLGEKGKEKLESFLFVQFLKIPLHFNFVLRKLFLYMQNTLIKANKKVKGRNNNNINNNNDDDNNNNYYYYNNNNNNDNHNNHNNNYYYY